MSSVKPLRVAALFNQSAGAPERGDSLTLPKLLAAAFNEHGITARMDVLPGAELHAAAARAVKDFAAGELDAVVVGGGDGSVSAVAGALAGTEVPLGILPLGTLNHFAKDLNIPLAVTEAVAVIGAGKIRTVDVADVNGEVFINNSSIGIYPSLVADRERRRSLHGLGKWSAMALAAWRTLRRFPLRRLSICADDCVEPFRSPCIFIGNNEYGLSGARLGKRAKLDGGKLCLYVARKRSRLALFWLALRSVAGWLDQSRDLRILKVSRAEITSRASRLLVALDGEVTMIRPPLRYRTRPGALRVFVPAA